MKFSPAADRGRLLRVPFCRGSARIQWNAVGIKRPSFERTSPPTSSEGKVVPWRVSFPRVAPFARGDLVFASRRCARNDRAQGRCVAVDFRGFIEPWVRSRPRLIRPSAGRRRRKTRSLVHYRLHPTQLRPYLSGDEKSPKFAPCGVESPRQPAPVRVREEKKTGK